MFRLSHGLFSGPVSLLIPGSPRMVSTAPTPWLATNGVQADSSWQSIHHSGPEVHAAAHACGQPSQMPPTFLTLTIHYLMAELTGDERQSRWQKFCERTGPLQEI